MPGAKWPPLLDHPKTEHLKQRWLSTSNELLRHALVSMAKKALGIERKAIRGNG